MPQQAQAPPPVLPPAPPGLGGAAEHGATLGPATLRPSKRPGPNDNPTLPKVCRDGFIFNQKKRLANGLRSCECEEFKRGCHARAYKDDNHIIVGYGPHPHNHGARPERERQLQVST